MDRQKECLHTLMAFLITSPTFRVNCTGYSLVKERLTTASV